MRNVNHNKRQNSAIGEFLFKKAPQFNGTDVLVFVPVYNEENTVAKVIKGIRDCCNFDLLVIDDGSTDSTSRILRQLDVGVLPHPQGMNSDVILSGLRVARALDYKYAIKIDGDMSISEKISSKQWEELEKEVKKLKEANKMAQMGLYEVVVVDTKKRKIIVKNIVIARNEDKAKMKVVIGHATDISDDVEFFVRCIGAWEDRKPKEVKIVKE